jgi:type VI protein secretion system component VasK
LLRLFLERGLLLALPFAAWFAWRAVARRTGRPMGSTPWPWLLAAGVVLMGLSLMVTALFRQDTRGQVYVPPRTLPDGRVTPGRFETPAEQKVRPQP